MHRSRSRSVGIVLSALTLAGLGSPALQAEEFLPRPADQDSAAIVTPHVRWAKPLEGGPVKALFLIRAGAAREAYELAQRLDLQFEMHTQFRGHQFSDTDTLTGQTHERLAELLKQDYNVILVGGVRLSALPLSIQYQLLKKLTEGTGVVFGNAYEHVFSGLGPAANTILTPTNKVGSLAVVCPTIPYHYFQGLKPTEIKKYELYSMGSILKGVEAVPLGVLASNSVCYTVKQGRCAVLASTGSAGVWSWFDAGLFPGASTAPDKPLIPEYMFSMLAKTVLWAANRTPSAVIEKVAPNGLTLTTSAVSAQPAEVAISATAAWSGVLRCVIRNRWNEEIHQESRKVTVPVGQTLETCKLPALGAGEYGLDVWLLKGDKVVDWGSGLFTVADPVTIEGIALAKPFFEPNEPVTAAVTVKQAPAGSLLKVSIRDSDHRILERTTYPIPGDGAVPVSLKVRHLNKTVYWLEADVESGGRSMAYARKEFTIPDRERDDYYCNADDGSQIFNHMFRLRFQRMRELGVDSIRGYGAEKPTLIGAAYDGIAPGSFFSHVGGCGAFGRTNACMSRPEYQQELLTGLTDLAATLQPYGVSCMNLGDDTGICESLCSQAACFGRFIEYLKGRYPDVAALNKVWRTQVGAWEEITPKFLGDHQAKGNQGPWLDYSYYHEDMYLDTFRKAREAVNAVDPHAWVGQDASGYANVLDLYVENQTYVCPYDHHTRNKQLGSYSHGKEGCYGSCTGVYGRKGRDPYNLSIPWDLVFAGNNGILFWTLGVGLAGDLMLYPDGFMMETIQELKNGIGNLLVKSDIQYAPVMLYHSRASKHATGIEHQLSFQSLSEDSFQTMIEDLGLQARWTATARAEKGEIQKRSPKAVILPYAQALSTQEVARLKDFVEQGGMLIADVRPALYDDHCQPLAEGALDAVFGIKRQAVDKYVASGDLMMKADYGAVKAGAIIMKTMGDLAVQPDTAVAHASVGEAPALLVNRYGKGQAVLLNCFVGKYASLLYADQAGPMRDLFREVLRQGGCERTYVAQQDGRDATGCELIPFKYEQLELLGVAPMARPPDQYPAKIAIRLPQARYVYDVRTGRYLGKTDKIQDTYAFMERKVFALLASPTRGINLSVTPREVKAGDEVTVEAALKAGASPGPRLIRMEVVGPDGRQRLGFRKKLWTKDGTIRVVLPFAYNDPAGRWQIKVTDVATGVNEHRALTLAAGEQS